MPPDKVYRFGPFCFDARSGELVSDERRTRLPGQSAAVLEALLASAGRLVTRDDLRERLWPNGTIVDFDHGLANAVRRLRDAIEDSASTPRYIETLPRRGYRFIAPVEVNREDAGGITLVRSATPPRPPVAASARLRISLRVWGWSGVTAVALGLVAAAFLTLRAPTPDANPAPIPQAREAYLRGKWFYDRKTPEDTARSIEYFREAVTLDPAYAPAHASLAAAGHFAAAMGVLDKTEAQRLTRASAERALELDPASGEALAILAESRFRFGGETDGVGELFRRAVALRPQDVEILHWYGMFLALTGQIGEALVQLERARDLDPLALHVGADYAEVLFMAGRRDEAMRQLARVRELDPEFPKTYIVEAHIALEEERHADAIAAMRRANELSPATPKYVASLAHLYALAGQPADAQRTLEELRTLTHAAPELIRALEQELATL